MAKLKFYTVWNGRIPGVYDTWDTCQEQIDGYSLAKYKSFKTRSEAEDAFTKGWAGFYGKTGPIAVRPSGPRSTVIDPQPLWDSICVDAACNTRTRVMEYCCVETAPKKQLFHQGPFPDGTNNVGEFLALAHALAWCKQKGLFVPIYSDSYNAIKWITQKKVNTHLEPTSQNQKLFAMINRSLELLNSTEFANPFSNGKRSSGVRTRQTLVENKRYRDMQASLVRTIVRPKSGDTQQSGCEVGFFLKFQN